RDPQRRRDRRRRRRLGGCRGAGWAHRAGDPRLDGRGRGARVPRGQSPTGRRSTRRGLMSRPLIFAANWKMHLGPDEARSFIARFLDGFTPLAQRSYWFFPTAVSLEATARAAAGTRCLVGVQDVHWEPKGAFTGATSVALAKAAGASLALIGHSE